MNHSGEAHITEDIQDTVHTTEDGAHGGIDVAVEDGDMEIDGDVDIGGNLIF